MSRHHGRSSSSANRQSSGQSNGSQSATPRVAPGGVPSASPKAAVPAGQLSGCPYCGKAVKKNCKKCGDFRVCSDECYKKLSVSHARTCGQTSMATAAPAAMKTEIYYRKNTVPTRQQVKADIDSRAGPPPQFYGDDVDNGTLEMLAVYKARVENPEEYDFIRQLKPAERACFGFQLSEMQIFTNILRQRMQQLKAILTLPDTVISLHLRLGLHYTSGGFAGHLEAKDFDENVRIFLSIGDGMKTGIGQFIQTLDNAIEDATGQIKVFTNGFRDPTSGELITGYKIPREVFTEMKEKFTKRDDRIGVIDIYTNSNNASFARSGGDDKAYAFFLEEALVYSQQLGGFPVIVHEFMYRYALRQHDRELRRQLVNVYEVLSELPQAADITSAGKFDPIDEIKQVLLRETQVFQLEIEKILAACDIYQYQISTSGLQPTVAAIVNASDVTVTGVLREQNGNISQATVLSVLADQGPSTETALTISAPVQGVDEYVDNLVASAVSNPSNAEAPPPTTEEAAAVRAALNPDPNLLAATAGAMKANYTKGTRAGKRPLPGHGGRLDPFPLDVYRPLLQLSVRTRRQTYVIDWQTRNQLLAARLDDSLPSGFRELAKRPLQSALRNIFDQLKERFDTRYVREVVLWLEDIVSLPEILSLDTNSRQRRTTRSETDTTAPNYSSKIKKDRSAIVDDMGSNKSLDIISVRIRDAIYNDLLDALLTAKRSVSGSSTADPMMRAEVNETIARLSSTANLQTMSAHLLRYIWLSAAKTFHDQIRPQIQEGDVPPESQIVLDMQVSLNRDGIPVDENGTPVGKTYTSAELETSVAWGVFGTSRPSENASAAKTESANMYQYALDIMRAKLWRTRYCLAILQFITVSQHSLRHIQNYPLTSALDQITTPVLKLCCAHSFHTHYVRNLRNLDAGEDWDTTHRDEHNTQREVEAKIFVLYENYKDVFEKFQNPANPQISARATDPNARATYADVIPQSLHDFGLTLQFGVADERDAGTHLAVSIRHGTSALLFGAAVLDYGKVSQSIRAQKKGTLASGDITDLGSVLNFKRLFEATARQCERLYGMTICVENFLTPNRRANTYMVQVPYLNVLCIMPPDRFNRLDAKFIELRNIVTGQMMEERISVETRMFTPAFRDAFDAALKQAQADLPRQRKLRTREALEEEEEQALAITEQAGGPAFTKSGRKFAGAETQRALRDIEARLLVLRARLGVLRELKIELNKGIQNPELGTLLTLEGQTTMSTGVIPFVEELATMNYEWRLDRKNARDETEKVKRKIKDCQLLLANIQETGVVPTEQEWQSVWTDNYTAKKKKKRSHRMGPVVLHTPLADILSTGYVSETSVTDVSKAQMLEISETVAEALQNVSQAIEQSKLRAIQRAAQQSGVASLDIISEENERLLPPQVADHQPDSTDADMLVQTAMVDASRHLHVGSAQTRMGFTTNKPTRDEVSVAEGEADPSVMALFDIVLGPVASVTESREQQLAELFGAEEEPLSRAEREEQEEQEENARLNARRRGRRILVEEEPEEGSDFSDLEDIMGHLPGSDIEEMNMYEQRPAEFQNPPGMYPPAQQPFPMEDTDLGLQSERRHRSYRRHRRR